jgi:hypothetical protein
MALVLKDRVREQSTTTGTGSFTLTGAVTGFQSFSSAIGNTNTTYYTISDNTNWESGIGTVSAGALSRDTVLASSNSGSLVNFPAGTKDVFVSYPAGKSVYQDSTSTAYAPQFAASNGFHTYNATIASDFTFPTGHNALSSSTSTVNDGITVTLNGTSEWVII